jgi:hypothetical protein
MTQQPSGTMNGRHHGSTRGKGTRLESRGRGRQQPRSTTASRLQPPRNGKLRPLYCKARRLVDQVEVKVWQHHLRAFYGGRGSERSNGFAQQCPGGPSQRMESNYHNRSIPMVGFSRMAHSLYPAVNAGLNCGIVERTLIDLICNSSQGISEAVVACSIYPLGRAAPQPLQMPARQTASRWSLLPWSFRCRDRRRRRRRILHVNSVITTAFCGCISFRRTVVITD